MKYIFKNLLILILLPVVLFQSSSCSKESFTKANVNPNAPDSAVVTPANILPSVEISLAYAEGGDLARFAGLFVQQYVGAFRQSQAYYDYIVTGGDLDNVWGNIYTSVLGNNKDLLTRADSNHYNVYGGISRILMAYTLQVVVDEWGSVPYSTALQGIRDTHPTYDSDRGLYDTIISLLNVAIAQLNNPNPGALTPSNDDLIYGGNVTEWIKFAHAIKARIYIHQSKGNPAMAAQALTEAAMSFTSNADNAFFTFGNTETSANPVYQFNEQRGDINYAAGFLPDTMKALNDPRYTDSIYIMPHFNDVNGVGIGPLFGGIGAPVQFIDYSEILFIEAEATLRTTGNIATAQTFYQNGITANMQQVGVPQNQITTYLAANGTLPLNVPDAIAKVAFQEYLALYLNPEAWTLYRRTGSPALVPTAGILGVPRRLSYPSSELTLNAANVPKATLFSPRIFWDN